MAYVNLPILETLLQVLVDGFIADLADERQVRNSDLLLLCRLEYGLLDLVFSLVLCLSGLFGLRFAPGAFGDGLTFCQ